ncbi:hypothetical protein CGCVW01_v002277 [Colletotrichum viniferum]|nr:hypothetical protein CGCVW01_v002277 [Colletotrichum viniferum]
MDSTSTHQKRPSSHNGDLANAKKPKNLQAHSEFVGEIGIAPERDDQTQTKAQDKQGSVSISAANRTANMSAGGAQPSPSKAEAHEGKENEDYTCKGRESTPWVQFETAVFDKIGPSVEHELDTKLPKPDLEALLPKTLPETKYDQDWTVKDEARLQASWQADPNREELIQYNDADIGKVFRQSLRFFGITPFELISERHRLMYGGNSRGLRDKWTGGFIIALYQLLPHPLWEGNVHLLVTALQYSSILRSRDLRSWKLNPPNDGLFFMVFDEVVKENESENRPISDLHEEVRQRLEMRGAKPVYSKFLQRLEEIVVPDARVDITDRNGSVDVYIVTKYDLEDVRKALDTTTHLGLPYFLPTEVIREQLYAKSTDNPPAGNELLKMYIERSLIAVRRYTAKNENRQKRLGDQRQPQHRRRSQDTPSKTYDGGSEEVQTEKDRRIKHLEQQLDTQEDCLIQKLGRVTELKEALKKAQEDNARLRLQLEQLGQSPQTMPNDGYTMPDDSLPVMEGLEIANPKAPQDGASDGSTDGPHNGNTMPFPSFPTCEDLKRLGIDQSYENSESYHAWRFEDESD